MSTVKESFVAGVSPTSLTVSGLSTLASGSSATSNAIDNSVNLGVDYIVQASMTTGASGTSATGYTEIYLQASLDNSFYPDATNDVLLDVVSMTVNATAYNRTFTVAKGQQGIVPNYFKLRFLNQSGSTFTAATVNYSAVQFTVA